ncbi:hypothetical protein ACOMHN_033746 [Nucella lapillus]
MLQSLVAGGLELDQQTLGPRRLDVEQVRAVFTRTAGAQRTRGAEGEVVGGEGRHVQKVMLREHPTRRPTHQGGGTDGKLAHRESVPSQLDARP